MSKRLFCFGCLSLVSKVDNIYKINAVDSNSVLACLFFLLIHVTVKVSVSLKLISIENVGKKLNI